MAEGVRIEIEAIDKATATLNNVSQKVGGLGSALQSVAGQAVGLVASGQALQKVVQFMQEAVTAAAEAETEFVRLDAALRSMGRSATAEGLGKVAAQLQSISAFDDEDLLRGFSALSKFEAIDTSKFEDIAKAAMDISAATGGDVASNMEAIGRILETGVIPRSWAFSAALKEQIKNQIAAGDTAGALNTILGELNQRYGGQATAQMNTYAGSVQHLKNQWAELKELIGGRWLEMGTGGTNFLATAVEQATNILGDFFNWFDARTSGKTGKSFVDWQYQQMQLSQSMSFNTPGMNFNITGGAPGAETPTGPALAIASNEAAIESFKSLLDFSRQYSGYQDQIAEKEAEIAQRRAQHYSETGGTIVGLKGELEALNEKQNEFMNSFILQMLMLSGAPADAIMAVAQNMGLVSDNAIKAYENATALAAAITEIPPNQVKTFEFYIKLTGDVEEALALTQTAFAGPTQWWQRTNSKASGGAFSGWAMVGDSPGGGVTPYTEFVYAPHGAMVYNRAQMSGQAPAPSAAIGGFIPPAVGGAAVADSSMEMREFARYIVDEIHKTTG